ncbi:hypothetical protein EJ08DRAFT_728652 [Tothia fuscella]|uniref:Inner kinetochore subunit AME1 domain-containing protein n=1 Tax=Tothia fuscella TaxID=1048955 RepID=A0A9P4U5G0_9PEZI|nr:hypothetical protein EJ08DRAFT_728652 [Tothia fuscella]
MASREERHLMRQRGAGPREMKNANFNFNFGGAPLPARRSSRKTPTGDLPARPSSRKTPQQLPPRLSARGAPGTRSARQSSGAPNRRSASNTDTAVRDANGSLEGSAGSTSKTPNMTGKRKRTSEQLAAVEEMEQDELEPDDMDLVTSKGHSIRKSIEGPFSAIKPRPIAAVAEEEVEDEDELSPEQPSGERASAPTPTASITHQTPSLARPKGKEKVDPNRRVSKSYMRGRSWTRKSVTGASTSFINEEEAASADELSPRNEATSAGATEVSSRAQGSATGLAAEGTSSLFVPNSQSTRREVFEPEDEDEEIDELTRPQAKKARRRTTEPIEIETEASLGAEEDDELSPQVLKQGKKRSRHSTTVQIREDAATDDELSPQQLQSRPRKPNTTRPPLSKTTANIPKTKPKSKPKLVEGAPPRKKQKTSKGTAKESSSRVTIPITVYRRTKPQDIDDDPFGADPTPSLNPADVLAQISSELTNAYIETYTTSSQQPVATSSHSQNQNQTQASKKTRKRQINALISFRDSLQDSLFDLTVAQNTTYILSMRVRKGMKEKRHLREELMARRREREEVELEIDRIQCARKITLDEKTRHETLVQSLFDIENAVTKGREKARRERRSGEGVVLGVDMLAESVFEGLGENSGILQRVRDWNGVLEEAAVAIEGRA